MPSAEGNGCVQRSSSRERSLMPVTLLSGFLGSGKTTLLRRILQGNHGLKVAVIVNDMAELNIDAALISKGASGHLVRRAESLVQMQNGCICCTLREDLLEEVSKLACGGRFDYCVVESTGISEPMQVAETFAFQIPEAASAAETAILGELGESAVVDSKEKMKGDKEAGRQGKKAKAEEHSMEVDPKKKARRTSGSEANAPVAAPKDGRQGQGNGKEAVGEKGDASALACRPLGMTTLMDVARLDTTVTVVDASRFFDDLTSIEELADRHPDEVPEGDMRNIAQLLVEQVEFADVILLNKADTVSKAQLKDIYSLLHRLNPIASVHETVHSQVPLSEVLNTRRFDMEKAGQAPGWLQAINTANAAERAGQQAAAKSESEHYGVTSFVYTARRPFHPGRLYRNFMRRFFLTQVMPVKAEDDSEEGEESEEGSSESTEHDAENGGRRRDEREGRRAGTEKADTHCDKPSDYQEARKAVLTEAKNELGSVMRSKGFFWLATQPNSSLGWSSAGALLQVTMEGPWFACVPKEEWPEDKEIQARIKADFCSDPDVGDRRQELVFIGQNLKEHAIRELLDTCQATDAEISAAVKGQLRDELFGGSDEEGSD